MLIPFDDPATTGAPVPSLYGLFPGCAPMLGPPHGGSPACNRVLVINGSVELAVPPGHYYVYATRGPFSSIDRAEVQLAPGMSLPVTLQVQSLRQLLPAGVVSGDFHVHGGASFDSSIPDADRVVSFLATGVDVIVATDHNVVSDYMSTLARLGATNSIVVIPGVEQTPNILWYYVPGDRFPKTLGHFNFWPLVPDFLETRNGAPWPELREPGQLMDDMDGAFRTPTTAVRQLNHPYLLAKLGRDQGYPQAIGYDPTTPIPATPTDGFTFGANALARAPGGNHRNIDWDVEEVMTGASRADWLRYRALWFSLLNQGFKRAGTANSDSHSLSNERIGYPRNLVWGGHDQGKFDFDSFDADVRAGHLEGTNGPVLDVTIDDGASKLYRPDMAPITVSATATLKISVAAAPWIPVTEARVFVNGALAHTFDLSSLFPSGDPFGTRISSGTVSLQLATLLPAKGDAWLVVEAGLHQDTPPDTDGDGLPDLPDADPPPRPPLEDPYSICEQSCPASGPRRSATRFSSTSTAAVGRRRACSEGRSAAAALVGCVLSCAPARRAPICRASPVRADSRRPPGRSREAPSRTAGRLRRGAGCLPGLRRLAAPARRALRRKRRARLRGPHHRQRNPGRAAADQRAERALDRPRSPHLPLRQRCRAGRDAPSFGPATIGYHLVLASGARTTIAAYLRALLPIDTARQSGVETGARAGCQRPRAAQSALAG